MYTVRFSARDLFGAGDHAVTVDICGELPAPGRKGAAMSGDHAGQDAAMARGCATSRTLLEQRGLVDPVELDRALEAFLARVVAGERRRASSPAPGATTASGTGCWPTRTPRCPRWACRWAAACRSSGSRWWRTPRTAQRRRLHAVLLLPDRAARARHRPGTRARPTGRAWCATRARVLREFGFDARPRRARSRVWDASAESRYMVLPRRPAGTDGARRAGPGRPGHPQRAHRRRPRLTAPHRGDCTTTTASRQRRSGPRRDTFTACSPTTTAKSPTTATERTAAT